MGVIVSTKMDFVVWDVVILFVNIRKSSLGNQARNRLSASESLISKEMEKISF